MLFVPVIYLWLQFNLFCSDILTTEPEPFALQQSMMGRNTITMGISPWRNNCSFSRPEGPVYNNNCQILTNGEKSKKSPTKTKIIYRLLEREGLQRKARIVFFKL